MLLEDGSYLLSPAIAGIFPGVETHLGFNGNTPRLTPPSIYLGGMGV